MPKKTKEEAIEAVIDVKEFLNDDLDKLSVQEKASIVSGIKEIVEKLNAEKLAEWDAKVLASEAASIQEIYSLIKAASAGLKALIKKQGAGS